MDLLLEEILTASQDEIKTLIGAMTGEDIAALITQHSAKVADPVFKALNQQSATRLLASCQVNVIRSALQRCTVEALTHFLRMTQASQLTKLLANANNELITKLIDAAPSHNSRIGIAKALPPERRRQWLELVREMEKDVGRTRAMTTDATSSLFEERQILLEELESAIRDRETSLRKIERETKQRLEQFASLNDDERKKLDVWRAKERDMQEKLVEQERVLSARIAELEEINRKQVQQRIEVKVPEYVAAALSVLDERESLFRSKAFWWSAQGVFVLLIAIGSAIAVSVFGISYGPPLENLTWQTLLFVSFKGLVLLGVLGLWAKHAFTVSNAYMHEAIKRSDRAHAINFGKLYLEIYGNSVERRELIDIFENWNIASESAFTKANPSSFTPEVVEKIDLLFKVFEKTKDKKE